MNHDKKGKFIEGETVVVVFTGNEEYGMRGAKEFITSISGHKNKVKVIVTDVIDRGYKKKGDFMIENGNNIGNWYKKVVDAVGDSDYKFKVKGNYMDDETCKYGSYGFECFSFCVPTKGEDMYNNKGLKINLSSYLNYIDALEMVCKV